MWLPVEEFDIDVAAGIGVLLRAAMARRTLAVWNENGKKVQISATGFSPVNHLASWIAVDHLHCQQRPAGNPVEPLSFGQRVRVT